MRAHSVVMGQPLAPGLSQGGVVNSRRSPLPPVRMKVGLGGMGMNMGMSMSYEETEGVEDNNDAANSRC